MPESTHYLKIIRVGAMPPTMTLGDETVKDLSEFFKSKGIRLTNYTISHDATTVTLSLNNEYHSVYRFHLNEMLIFIHNKEMEALAEEKPSGTARRFGM